MLYSEIRLSEKAHDHRRMYFCRFITRNIVGIDKQSGELIDYYFHSTIASVCIQGLTTG